MDDEEYRVSPIQDLCRAKGVRPLASVLAVLSGRSNSLTEGQSLVRSSQSDSDVLCMSTVVRASLPSVTELSIAGQHFSPSSLRLLGNGLKQNTSLRALSLQSNHITDDDNFLAGSLSNITSLISLDLSWNE
jgi:hypothetical protein